MLKRKSIGELVFDAAVYALLIFLIVIILYPVLYVVLASFSDPKLLQQNRDFLWKPLGFTLGGYELVFKDKGIVTGYLNTIFYVTAGVAVNMIFTSLGAYVLSRRDLLWKKTIMIIITFTMFFGGGLVPWFLLVRNLGMYNNWTALVFPFAINTWNMIILRTGFESVPEGLQEAAKIDGANDFDILIKVVLPLSKATLAVILLYYIVGAWNSWFPAMIFLRDRNKFPLQLIMREILIVNDVSNMQQDANVSSLFGESNAYRELVKYATIVVASFPIMCIYPFMQKYFVKGVMLGSLKG